MLFPVAKEGRLFVIVTAWMAVITLLSGLADLGLFLVILMLALMALFRDLRRRAPAQALGLVAPVDGVVESVETTTDPFTGREAERIRIRQRYLGEYNIHAPQEVEVRERVWPGQESDREPDLQLAGRLAFALATDEDDRMTLALSVTHWPRFIRMVEVLPGNRLGRGKRIGFAGFGGRAELWLPRGSHVMVRPGQVVLAGTTLLGGLPPREPGDQGGAVELAE